MESVDVIQLNGPWWGTGHPNCCNCYHRVFRFVPSKWVVTRARNYGGVFIAAVIGTFADDGTAPVRGRQIKNWEKVKVWLQAKYR